MVEFYNYLNNFCRFFFLLLTGTLHVGDEIREINSTSVINQTVESLQKMLVRDQIVLNVP